MSQTSSKPVSMESGDTRKPVIACQQLSKVFKDFWMRDRARAVDRLDLVIKQGEVFGLLGPNGSGKSTTIKLILGLLKPTSGRVMVFGKSPSDVATKARIGYLPEESYLYPFLNARETLEYYAKLFGIDSKTRASRIDELLDMVGLTHAQFRPVREYSKGMQRRIGIAQALINDPELLILDEPTTGLDPIGTRQVKDLILELGRRGKTVILSSHLLTDVEDVVDRMVILYGGRIRGEGSCDELLSAGDRTSIESDELDDETIAEIDEVIRRRSGGEKSIRSVSVPRQRLEELFLGIVEQARNEQTKTSGATEGGATAAFLTAAQALPLTEGSALIAGLLEDKKPEPDPEANENQSVDGSDSSSVQHPTSDDDGVLDSLLRDDDPEPIVDKKPAQRDEVPSDEQVDLGVIGSLVDDEEDDQDKEPGQ